MYCPQCGKEISDQAKFCRFCGSRLDGLYEPQPARQKKHRSAKIAGIVICIAAILIVIPLTLFAVFRFRTGSSAELSGRNDAAGESLEREQTRPDSSVDAGIPGPSPDAPAFPGDSADASDHFLPFAGETAGGTVPEGLDSVEVSWTRMNHSYWDEVQSGAFVNCYYDLASVPEDTELGGRINAELNAAYQAFLENNKIGGMYDGGFDEGEINYEIGMEGTVAQNANGLLSLKYHYNWNMGGVGDGSASGVTIDLKTGERLYLSDIRPIDGSAITFPRMEEIALNYFASSGAEVEPDLLQQFREQSLDDLEFYMEEDQIILCIAKYELGPGAMGAPEIPTGIYCNVPEGERVDIDPRILPASLTEFLQGFDFAYYTENGGREYDCRNLENVYNTFLKGIVGNPTYVNVSLFTEDIETSWDSGADPLGRYPAGFGYVTVPERTALFIMENVFNIGEGDAAAMIRAAMDADPDLYEFDRNGEVYLCNKIGGVGGPGFEITFESIQYDGEKYYIVYDCTDAIPVDARTTVYYAEMALKETDGLEYWSLYYHSEEIPGAGEPAEAAPDSAADSEWLGTWMAETGESLEIYDVSETGLSLVFHKIIETGELRSYDYEMEFDDVDQTIASEIGGPMDHGGWEYTFVLGDGIITVESRYPDQIFYRESY